MLLPGIKVNTSPTDFYPIKQMQMHALQRSALGAVRARSSAAVRAAEAKDVSPPGCSGRGKFVLALLIG